MRPALPILLAFLALVAASCGGGGSREAADRSPSPSSGSDAPRPDTSRAGPAFLAIYRSGPLDELRVVRATDGRIVVAGLTEFPDGTRLQLTLSSPVGAGAPQALAVVGARVEGGRFMSPPLAGESGPPPPGVHPIHLTATFGPTDQDRAVLDASAQGRRFRGPGVRTLDDGRVRFEVTLEAPL